ncbi:thioredoxin family protein [Pelistega ratti]|uniref:thioredoxin family protein n=1 Tax=Pelistega ratti TaxID=2652177 RepID=UPI00135C0BB1|nr:thioredoxin family protein [Pelistega ratti]
MFINDIVTQAETLKTALTHSTGLTIACYCAQWCNTCTTYLTAFEQLSQQFPQHLFVWIDIEDSPELLDDIDVENFPTILIQQQDKNFFFGTMLPHIEHLKRLIQTTEENLATTYTIQNGPDNLANLLEG